MGGNQIDAYDPPRVGSCGISGNRRRPHHHRTDRAGLVYATRDAQDLRCPAGRRPANCPRQRRLVAYSSHARYALPSCLKDWLFTVTDNGIAQCFDARTGGEMERAFAAGRLQASPIAADGKLYSQTSRVSAPSSKPDRASRSWRRNQLDDDNRFAGRVRRQATSRGPRPCIALASNLMASR